MALKPLGDRIIVRFEETEEKTASGFVLAGASHETTKTAEVLAVGEGTRTLTGELIAPSIAVGDKVLVENSTISTHSPLAALNPVPTGLFFNLSMITEPS